MEHTTELIIADSVSCRIPGVYGKVNSDVLAGSLYYMAASSGNALIPHTLSLCRVIYKTNKWQVARFCDMHRLPGTTSNTNSCLTVHTIPVAPVQHNVMIRCANGVCLE